MKKIHKNINRKIIGLNFASSTTTEPSTTVKPTTTKKPTTTPECTKDTFCSIPHLLSQKASKETTKNNIQSRITANKYDKAIDNAQKVLDGINASIESNKATIKEKNNSIKTLEEERNLCVQSASQAGPGAIERCQNKINQQILKRISEIESIKKTNLTLEGTLSNAEANLKSAKNIKNKDIKDLEKCQEAIDALVARIAAIEASCGKKKFPCP